MSPTEPDIRFGLSAVRNLGAPVVAAIVGGRDRGRYPDLYGFLAAVDPNPSGRSVILTDAYTGERAVVRLNPGKSQVHKIRPRGGWYEVSLSGDLETTYARRPVGHVEDGKPSLSEPLTRPRRGRRASVQGTYRS